MSVNQWVYRIADGQLCLGDGPDPAAFLADAVNYAVIDLGPGAVPPSPRLQRVVPATQQLRAATADEIAAWDSALKDRQSNVIDVDLLIQAVAQLDFEERQKLQVKAGQTLRTAAECKARVKTIYRGLL